MEILAAIVGKLAEFTVAPIGRQVGYLAHHKSNHQNLQTKLEDLSAARDEVQHKVDQFRRGGLRIETAVLNWNVRVDAIITESEEFLQDGRHAQTECLHGFCPHLVLRYQLSKKSTKLVEEIEELYGKKFSNFASMEIPTNFFEEMKTLKVLEVLEVLDFTNAGIPSPPPSLQFLKNVQTLCLEECVLADVAQVGQLSNLEILSFARSNIRELPKEIGYLIRLRWLDLSDCAELISISPDVISRLERLEGLKMRNIFLKWEAERGGINASLLELKDLSQLTALEIYIQDANILPPNLFSSKLVRYQIYIGDVWMSRFSWEKKTLAESTLNTLKLKLASSNELDQGIKMLLKRSEDLSLDGTESVNRIVRQLHVEDFQQLIHLRLQNNVDFTYIINRKAVFPNLTTLTVHKCDRLSFLFSSSMTKSLVELKHLEISTCEIIEEIVSSSEYCQQNVENMFPQLEDLKLNKLPNLTRFCSGGYIQLPSLEKLDIQGCTKLAAFISDNIAMSGKNTRIYKEIEEKDSEGNNSLNTVQYFLFDEKMGLPNLTSLVVHRCNGLRFLSSMARSLVQLKHLVISECQIMEVVLTEVYNEENKDNMFPMLEQLKLNDLPFLDRFCSGSYVEFASLEGLHLEKCPKLETFICNPLSNSIASSKEVEERNRNQNIETVVPYFLFDKKVGFPKLERLIISDLPKLKTIWHTQLAPDSFCRLRDVTLQQCNSLKTILPDSLIAGVFQLLEKLTVDECGVEEIIFQGGEPEKSMHDQFVFPNLICLEFRSLFQLKRFYPRLPAFSWPLLKTLLLLDCQKVDIFAGHTPAAKLLTPAKQSSILINENSFPKLEDLTLIPMDIWYCRPNSAVCCEKSVFGGISNRHTDASLPHLRTLRLHGILDMRLWENTIPAGQNSPQLEILEVKFCRLNNLELSSLSFQNLTILEATFCWRLQYLTTYSVARSLRLLRKLKVAECKSMKQILASEGIGEDGSNCEIVFSQLQHLELSDLISLECFCPSNCTVKVPSLETLEVKWCSIQLKVSSSGILVVDSNMHLDVQKSHSSKEAFNTTGSSCSSEKTQKQPVTNSSEEAEHIEFNALELHDDSLTDELNKHGPLLPGIAKREHAVEGVIQETSINSQNMEHHEVMGLNQKQIVTNTTKNLQDTLIERLEEELRAKKADIRRMEEELRPKKADVRLLEEELRAKKADVREERS